MELNIKLIRIEAWVFYALLALWLVPVWSVDFFVTGDGPCHLYNSKILLDWGSPEARAFYKPFYFLNTNFDPNWLYNLITVPLLKMFDPGTAEKVFFTLYALGFGLGFRYLITKINPHAKFISSLALLFCFNKLVMMGFLNNCLSMAIWFWVVGWWWGKRDDLNPYTLLKLGLLLLLLFSAHPMGYTNGGMMMGSMLIGLCLYEFQEYGVRPSLQMLIKRGGSLLVSALPSLVLFVEFAFRRNWAAENSKPNMMDSLRNFVQLTSLQTMHSTERDLAKATAIACILLFLGAVFLRLRGRKWRAADGILLFVGIAFFSILKPPSSISGGLEVSFRLGMIPFFAMLCWAATANFPQRAEIVGLLTAIVLTFGFLADRMPRYKNASNYAVEIRSCAPYIKDSTRLLTLNYDWTGHTSEGAEIANKIWLFPHVDCYLGTDKTMVISDNYETHYWYFPIISHWETDMYSQTDKDGINFDNRPPRADILSFGRRARTKELDYVLLLGFMEAYKDNPYTIEIFNQLSEAYEPVFTSQNGRAKLYKRRGI